MVCVFLDVSRCCFLHAVYDDVSVIFLSGGGGGVVVDFLYIYIRISGITCSWNQVGSKQVVLVF